MPRRLCLVTGASAGIGAAFARLYAKEGWDLVLTARRAERLEALAGELRQAHGIEALALPADLADPAAPATLAAALAERGLIIDALVNNAGYGLTGAYEASSWEAERANLQVMLMAVCELTRHLAPGMMQRRYGRIINVASLAGLAPGGPGHALYAATKAFLVRFSQSLHLEARDYGVHVTALCPGFTHSEFHDVNGTREAMSAGLPRFVWQDAETVARAGYAAGEKNRAVCVPGAVNKLGALAAKLTPERWALAFMAKEARRLRRM
jgi:short-subunit dehydrogenase